ncbi:MAG: hypothetical protein MJ094_02025 [Saccharofermentans sp.]|nr:hypothetical protein [Saccharofermentans sp.]
MKYYIVNLIAHLIVTVILFIVIVVGTNRNKKRETKHVLTYFLPLIASALMAFYLITITGPRLLDLTDVVRQNYYSYTGVIDEVSPANNYLVVDGVRYYINPLRYIPEVGQTVRIKYTQYSKYSVSVEVMDEIDITESINEELETAVVTPTDSPRRSSRTHN